MNNQTETNQQCGQCNDNIHRKESVTARDKRVKQAMWADNKFWLGITLKFKIRDIPIQFQLFCYNGDPMKVPSK